LINRHYFFHVGFTPPRRSPSSMITPLLIALLIFADALAALQVHCVHLPCHAAIIFRH
jgi:hypothetical protein